MPPKQHFLLLDGLRGLAALVVMAFHIWQSHGDYMPRFAPLAVDFFFLLSGFVVAYAYEERLRTAAMSAGRFVAIRLVRLYPMILLGMAMGLAISAARMLTVGDIAPAQFASLTLSSLLVLPSWALPQYPTAFPANMALWSLFFEIVANLVYALIARRLSDRVLLAIIALSALALILATVAHGSVAMGMNKTAFAGGVPRVMFAFFAGVWLFRHWRSRPASVAAHPALAWALAAAFTALLLVPLAVGYWADLTLVLVVFPAIIVAASRLGVEGAGKRWCMWLGALSYPLYALHAPILRASEVVLGHLPALAGRPALVFAVQAIPSIVFALIAMRWYDIPVRAWLGERLLRRRAVA